MYIYIYIAEPEGEMAGALPEEGEAGGAGGGG